jgi:hypothetical protein
MAVDADFSFRGEVTMFKISMFVALLIRGVEASSRYPTTCPDMFR